MTPAKAVILAREPVGASTAGFGEAPGGGPGSPALACVANEPLLRHALEWLEVGGVRRVAVLASDRLAPAARDIVASRGRWGFEVDWLVQSAGESFGDALAALTGFLDGEPFVLHLADSLARETLCSLVGETEPSSLEALFLVHGKGSKAGSVIDIRDRRLPSGLSSTGQGLSSCAGAGVAVLGSSVAAAATSLDAWPGQELDVLAARLELLGGRVDVRRADGWWRFGRGREALLDGNRFALEALKGGPVDAELVDSCIQGAVCIHPSARLESTTVRGPAVIGPRTQLHEAYVGPYTSIGPDVVIEGAEVENSIVLAEASVRHLGSRLEASIVGSRARVFRDFRLPRALRINVGEGAEVSVA